MNREFLAIFIFALLAVQSALADPPNGYYDMVDATNSTTLRTTLHAVIDDHTRFPYTSGATDTWDILNLADEDPNNSDHILDVYKNASYPKISGGDRDYEREHTWPKSYGFPDDGPDNYPSSHGLAFDRDSHGFEFKRWLCFARLQATAKRLDFQNPGG